MPLQEESLEDLETLIYQLVQRYPHAVILLTRLTKNLTLTSKDSLFTLVHSFEYKTLKFDIFIQKQDLTKQINHSRDLIPNGIHHLWGFRGLHCPFTAEYQGREFADTVYTFGVRRPRIEPWTFRSRSKRSATELATQLKLSTNLCLNYCGFGQDFVCTIETIAVLNPLKIPTHCFQLLSNHCLNYYGIGKKIVCNIEIIAVLNPLKIPTHYQ